MDAAERGTGEISLLEKATMAQVTWRLVPILGLGYFCNLLDRANIAIAATTMNVHLHLTAAAYGFGAGVLYLGYLVGEVPSNLILQKVGARRWIARILVTWALVSGLTAFVWNEWSFYAVRVCLGLAEAGFFPGVILYMTWWFPAAYRTRILAMFYSAIVISLIIGPPIGSLLLKCEGVFGLHGWQFLFLVEMLPTLVMGYFTLSRLTDRPQDATWLTLEQRTWLSDRIESERLNREAVKSFTFAETFYNPKIVLLTIAYFCHNVSQQVLVFFLPLIVKGLGVPSSLIGVVSGIPFVFALVGMFFWGKHSDKTGERTWHLALGWFLCAAGMAACILVGGAHPVLLMAAICFAAVGTWCAPVIFWSLPSSLLSGVAAASGIAVINALGNLGGWVGPWMFGVVKDVSGSDNTALFAMASGALVAGLIALIVGHDRRLEGISVETGATEH